MAKAPQKAAKEISSSKGAAKGKSAAKKVKAREKGKSRTLPARRTREGSGKKNHALSHLVSYETAQEIMALLCRRYPDAECELAYESPFQLLIAVILSAQTTDAQVNKVTPRLFKRFPTAQALANGSLDEIKEIIRPTGYYNAKATSIQNAARGLVEKFAGQVPKTLEELTTLPGIGRKTANVVLGV
ncbi:MAG TPA: endonuclease III, partial [Candidatus Obscuribacterales bacterium]